jgi:hypothetical protein
MVRALRVYREEAEKTASVRQASMPENGTQAAGISKIETGG